MKEIRITFHDLANKLNKISIEGGSAVEIGKLKDIDNMSREELKQELKKAMDALSNAVDSALESGAILNNLKKSIYKELNIDTAEHIE